MFQTANALCLLRLRRFSVIGVSCLPQPLGTSVKSLMKGRFRPIVPTGGFARIDVGFGGGVACCHGPTAHGGRAY